MWFWSLVGRINSKRFGPGIEKEGGKALVVAADVTSPADCTQVFEQTINTYGKVDILVNNAGIIDRHTPTIRVTDELWHQVIAINLTGTFLFCREALKHMTKVDSRRNRQCILHRRRIRQWRGCLFRLQIRRHRFDQEHRHPIFRYRDSMQCRRTGSDADGVEHAPTN